MRGQRGEFHSNSLLGQSSAVFNTQTADSSKSSRARFYVPTVLHFRAHIGLLNSSLAFVGHFGLYLPQDITRRYCTDSFTQKHSTCWSWKVILLSSAVLIIFITHPPQPPFLP